MAKPLEYALGRQARIALTLFCWAITKADIASADPIMRSAIVATGISADQNLLLIKVK